jgi:hypothetical protein
MVPAALIAPCLVWWHSWVMAEESWQDLAMVPLGLAAVLLVAALVNAWAYVADHWANVYANIRFVQNSTPEVRMMEAAKGMHPEAVKALLVHRRTLWRIKYVPHKELVDWVLDEAPNVHAGFVDFVLDHSNGTLMPKRLLAEGSTKFDPDGLVTDYQQYDELLFLMKQKLMCTEAYGNQSPHFLPPWNVDTIRHRFGLDGEGYPDGVSSEMSAAMQAVVKAQGKTPLPSASPQLGERNLGGEVGASDVVANALKDLEQTQLMKANADRVYKLKS